MNMIMDTIGTFTSMLSSVPGLNMLTQFLGGDGLQGGDTCSCSSSSAPQDSCALSQEDDDGDEGAGTGFLAGWGNDAPGSEATASAGSSTSGAAASAQSGQPLPSSLQMPTQILENVVLCSGKISSQDKDAIKQCIGQVQQGKNLSDALDSLSSSQKTELEGAIAGAGFKPPPELKQYSKDPSKDYSPFRLDCALDNVDQYQKTGSLQGTQAYKLEHLVPILGPLVTDVLNVGLGCTANMESNSQGLGASSSSSASSSSADQDSNDEAVAIAAA